MTKMMKRVIRRPLLVESGFFLFLFYNQFNYYLL